MGEATTLPWTLKNYIKLSGASYPSRVHLYCVNLHTNSGKNFQDFFTNTLPHLDLQRVIKISIVNKKMR